VAWGIDSQVFFYDFFNIRRTHMELDYNKAIKLLRRKAKPLYVPTGANSWEHVNQDLYHGKLMLNKVYNRDYTLPEYAAILFHDSSVKAENGNKDDHALHSAQLSRPLLKATGLFSDKDLDEIFTAIAEHDDYVNPGGSRTGKFSDLLASADAVPLDFPWILNKGYLWGMRHGYDDEKNMPRTANALREYYGTDTARQYPKLYSKYYGKRIKDMHEYFDKLTGDDVREIVTRYRKRHKLGPGDTRMPDPDPLYLDKAQ
jgi:hypothetical protein